MVLGPEEAHREQNQLRRPNFFRAGYFSHRKSAARPLLPADLHGMDGLDATLGIRFELFGRKRVGAGIGAELGGHFFLTVVHQINFWPLRPRVIRRALVRWLRQNLEL